MSLALNLAPEGKPLVLSNVDDPDLAQRLKRMGLFQGTRIMRLDQDIMVQPVRVRGPKGEFVLGGGMAMKTVVHLDDGRKLPLSEMQPGELGHIEGQTGGPGLALTLETLQIETNERIQLVRKLPPMEYTAVIINAQTAERIHLTEGMAAKIWGRMQDCQLQFVSARTKEKFHVLKILGGTKATQMLSNQGIEAGKTLILENVGQAKSMQLTVRNPVVITSNEGLRLFLDPQHAGQIQVREINPEKLIK
jgi:Fe2+ transport system protein FeoA